MKTLWVAALLLVSVSAMADEWRGHRGYEHEGHGWRHSPDYGWGWSVPIIVGGVIVGYEMSRVEPTPPVVVQQPTTVVVQQPVPTMQNCSPWTETQHPDGTITRTRTCNQ